MRGDQCRCGETQLTAAEIQGMPFPILQRELDGRRDTITDLFAASMSLHQSGFAKNSEVMRRVRLRQRNVRVSSLTHRSPSRRDSRIRKRLSSPMAFGTAAHCRAVTRRLMGGPAHQQQLASGEQLTASPSTAAEFRW